MSKHNRETITIVFPPTKFQPGTCNITKNAVLDESSEHSVLSWKMLFGIRDIAHKLRFLDGVVVIMLDWRLSAGGHTHPILFRVRHTEYEVLLGREDCRRVNEDLESLFTNGVHTILCIPAPELTAEATEKIKAQKEVEKAEASKEMEEQRRKKRQSQAITNGQGNASQQGSSNTAGNP